MDIELFDYNLPDKLIAQQPTRNRDESRLMVLNRSTGLAEPKQFCDIIEYINPGDCLIVNNTKVFKARLIGQRVSGGGVEIFLVRKLEADSNQWLALAQPSRRLKAGEKILFHEKALSKSLTLVKYIDDGQWEIAFKSAEDEKLIIDTFGHVPLPQYIKRDDTISDINRYQTIFAHPNQQGAVAAPTAGFHFTDEIVTKLKSKGVNFGEVTLHVGPGTFKPVSVDNIEEHFVDPEMACLPQATADLINRTKANGGRIFAVGTTSVRTIESAEIADGRIKPFEKFVDLYIQPGYNFSTIDCLLTNFHLPKSSLLILVSALAGRENILQAYNQAIAEQFRFYSYGDAMLIL